MRYTIKIDEQLFDCLTGEDVDRFIDLFDDTLVGFNTRPFKDSAGNQIFTVIFYDQEIDDLNQDDFEKLYALLDDNGIKMQIYYDDTRS